MKIENYKLSNYYDVLSSIVSESLGFEDTMKLVELLQELEEKAKNYGDAVAKIMHGHGVPSNMNSVPFDYIEKIVPRGNKEEKDWKIEVYDKFNVLQESLQKLKDNKVDIKKGNFLDMSVLEKIKKAKAVGERVEHASLTMHELLVVKTALVK